MSAVGGDDTQRKPESRNTCIGAEILHRFKAEPRVLNADSVVSYSLFLHCQGDEMCAYVFCSRHLSILLGEFVRKTIV